MNAPVRRLWLAVALGYAGLGATLQLLPSHLEDRWGLIGPAVPVLVSAAFLATAAVRRVAGRMADNGRAWQVAWAGALLTVLGAVVQWAAPSVPVLALGRLAMGAGEGLLFSGALPWVLAALPPGRRGRGAGWFGLSMWVGLAVGPAATAWLGSMRLGWCVAVGAPAASLALLTTVRRDRVHAPRPGRAVSARFMTSPRSQVPGLYLGLCAYGYGTVIGLLAVHTRESGVASDASLAVLAASFLVVRAAGSPAVDRFGAARMAAVLAVVEAIGLAMLVSVGDVVGVLVAAGLVGTGVGLAYPCAVALTLNGHSRGSSSGTRSGPADRAGEAVGTTTSWWDLGLLAAGLGGGALVLAWGPASAFATAAVMAAAAGVVALLHTRVHAATCARFRRSGDLP